MAEAMGKPCTAGSTSSIKGVRDLKEGDIKEFVEDLAIYNCIGRDYRVSSCKFVQYLRDDVGRTALGERDTLIGTGSSSEAMPRQVCGDKDFMLIKSTWPIVVFEPPGNEGNVHVDDGQGHVVAQANTMHPAFITLGTTNNAGSLPASMFLDGYLSSEMFVDELCDKKTERHGPAHASAAFPTVPGKYMRDLVPCLSSPQWPSCAREFFSRPKPHGWPSPMVVSEIKQGGCHVVGKAAPGTDRSELDFRWSFSVAEKSLCHDMDDQMAACMYLLKSIKKRHWPDDSFSGICSFYFKTGCFWVFEENEASATVLPLVGRVLDWLIENYNDRFIPNYFIPEQNLICELSAETSARIATQLTEIKRDLPVNALLGIKIEKPVVDLVKRLSKDRKVTLGDIDHECDGNELLDCLANSKKAGVILKEVRKDITLGTVMSCKKDLNCFLWKLMTIELDSYNTIQAEVPDNGRMEPGRPEVVLERTLQNYSQLVPDSMIKPIEIVLNRVIGDVYLKCLETIEGDSSKLGDRDPVFGHLTTFQAQVSIEHNQRQHVEELRRLALVYYERANVPLYGPDGSSDKGFLGVVNLAKFYYVTKQHKKFKALVKQLEIYHGQNIVGEYGLTTLKGLTSLTNKVLILIAKPSSDGILKTLTRKLFPGSFLSATGASCVFCLISAKRANSKLRQLRAALGLMKAMVFWLNSWYYEGNDSEQAVIKRVSHDAREKIPAKYKKFVEKKGFSKLYFLDEAPKDDRNWLLNKCECLCCLIPK